MDLKWTENAIILFYSLSPFLYLARTVLGDSGFTAILLRSFEPIIIMIFVLSSIKYVNRGAPKEWWALLFIGFYGIVVGILQGNQVIDVISTFTHYFCGLVIFFYYYQQQGAIDFERFLHVFSTAVLSSVAIVVTLIYFSPQIFGKSIYLGLATQALIVVFAFNIHRGKFFLAAITLALIVASGKRGVLVALLIGSFIVAYPIMRRYRRTLSKFIVLSILVLPVVLVTNLEVSEKLVAKFSFDSDGSLDHYSAGRIYEVRSALLEWQSSELSMLWGSGFGFSYTYLAEAEGLDDVEYYRNVHFSYVNPMISTGLFSLVYFLCMFNLLAKSFISATPLYLKWSLACYLVYACFVFNLFNEPILWLILGSMMAVGGKIKIGTHSEFKQA